MQAPKHQPVMTSEVIACLSPKAGETYLDLTAGYGGHASAIRAAAGKLSAVVLVDRDEQAISSLRAVFTTADIVHADFLSASRRLVEEERRFDMVLADLGTSSPHLNEPGRGFSFGREGPLDMRMDQRQSLTAYALVNKSSQAELADIISRFGQEPRAGRIAKAIVEARPLSSTLELAQVIEGASPRRFGRRKIHPATKTFQALRIAVNDELNQLEQALPLWLELIAPGGRLAVISFHSLEDRLVKRFFAEHAGDRYDAELLTLTKKPLTPKAQEIVSNPRARSAKLRAAAKIKTKRKG